MARPQRLTGNATPVSINGGRVSELQTIFAHNPSESAGAYVKVYATATTPDGNSIPIASVFVPPGAAGSGGVDRVIPLFVGGSNFWIAVATEFGAGLTGPASNFAITATYEGQAS
jgi:hypothetical protein